MYFDVVDFEKEVIEKSQTTPVLVDFWAAWCGPCRTLSPVLEQMANEAEGKWVLAKVNVEQQKKVAVEYSVRGIPDVHLIYKGEDIGRFTGALPKSGIQRFLDDHLPSPERDAIAKAKQLIAGNQRESAIEVLEPLMENFPQHNLEAAYLLAQLVMFSNPSRALILISDIKAGHPLYPETEEVRFLLELMEKTSSDLPEIPIRDKYTSAIEALRAQDYDAALERFIEVIMINKAYEDEGARKACIAIFHHLGEQHETTKKYRKRFSMALY